VHEATPVLVRGHVVWTSQGTEPVVEPFRITSVPLLEILGLCGQQSRTERMRAMSLRDAARHWAFLADALLPGGLRSLLIRAGREAPLHLVVVPDGPLSVLPWSALRLADGRFLIEAASVQQAPTLDFLTDPRLSGTVTPPIRGQVLAYLDAGIEQPAERYEVMGMDDVVVARDLIEVLERLRSGAFSGAYIAAHGAGSGLGQHVVFAGSGVLSAATALSLRWPSWTVFASCLVGSLDMRLGQEPLGLPISCLLGGSRSVVGGVIEVHSAISGRLVPTVATDQYAGAHAADALRAAQLAFLRQPARPAAPFRWAGFVCFARDLPARCFR
jgi:hypothetical protein